jgi:uncharacterized SAM-binding protein YcdF (DUF218 family)
LVHNTPIRKRRRPRIPDPTRHDPGKQGPRRPRSWKPRVILAAIAVSVLLLAWAVVARGLAPTSNTSPERASPDQTGPDRTRPDRFDAIIVLGSPADSDGNPTPEQLARVTEGVHEYQRGVAPHLILTGGATKYGFVEARVMAHAAQALGIPDSAIFMEPEAKDTIHNACYSARIMKAHGWRSAEVVSTDWHLPRAGIIFDALPIEWRTHAAPALTPESPAYLNYLASVEVLKTARYLVWARWADSCTP